MYDVITIGSATVDILMKSTAFHLQPTEKGVLLCQEYGGKLDVEQFSTKSGGAGTNSAVAFQRLGLKTAAVIEVGKDIFAQIIWDDLKREHVSTDFVISEKSEETAVSVMLISGEGGRSALTHRGASSMLEARDIPWQALDKTRWIHLSNVSGEKELLVQLFEFLHHHHIGLSWNPGQPELKMLVDGGLAIDHLRCDILFMNQEEWQVLEKVQSQLLKKIPTIVITNGKEGGTVHHQHHQFPYRAKSVTVMQETGAGDAFASGFVGAHLLGRDIPTCAAWGVTNAAGVIQHFDTKTGLMTRAELEGAADAAP